MTTGRRRWKAWLADGAVAALVTAAIMGGLLAAGGIWEHVGGDDLHGWFLPRYEEAARAIVHEGRLPLWNPWEFTGAPLLAQAQGSIYPPVPVLFAALPPRDALQALIALDVLVLAWGLVAYLRRHAIPRWAGALATAVTVAGVFSTPSGVGIDHPDFLASLAWVPWVLLCWDHAVRDGVRPWLGLLGLAVGMEWLGGYPDFGMNVAVLLGAMAFVADGGTVPRRIGMAAAGYALGVAIAAIQLLPLAEAVGESVRAANVASFDLTRAFMAYGRTGLWRGLVWGGIGPGLAAWALVALGLVRIDRTRLAWLVALLWCVFALDPPLDLLYRLPPFHSSRYPHAWSNLLPLFAGLLAAAGAAMAGRRAPRLVRVAAIALVLATAVRAGAVIGAAPTRLSFHAPDHALLERRIRILRRTLTRLPGTPRVVSHPEQNAGAFLADRLRAAAGYDPSMPPRRVRAIIDAINAGTLAHGMVLHVARAPQLAALLGVGVVTAPAGPAVRRLETLGFRPMATLPPGDVVLYRLGVPRVRLVHRVAVLAGEEAVVARLRDRAHDPTRVAILPPTDAAAVGALGPGAAADAIRLVEDAPERLVLAVHATSPALAVVSDAYYPGWRATVDGAPVAIRHADWAFRAVPVPAGDHRIEMRYAPTSVRAGTLVSAVALLAAVLLLLPGREPRRPA